MRTASRPRVSRSGLTLIAAIAVLVSACRPAGAAGPTPATFSGVAQSLRAHGIEISKVVSGEAGCDDRTLMSAAIAFDAVGLDQAVPVRVHLYTFGNGAAYQRLAHLVDTCAGSYPGTGATTRLDTSPYVAAGRGTWGSKFGQSLREALAQAEPLGP